MVPGSTKSVQTAFRFSPDLLVRMKNRARLRGQSLNSYVESLARKDIEGSTERYETLYRELSDVILPEEVSGDIAGLSRFKVDFSREEKDSDERLSYLLER